MKFKNMTIGIPKEIMEGENRVAAIPETVAKMVEQGAKVFIQSNAGKGSHIEDNDYKQVGAEIVKDVEEIYQRSDIILKVKEPLFNEEVGKHEVDMMKNGQYLITFLHPASPQNHETIKKLAEKGVVSFTLDSIPRISKAQQMDALTSMSTVAGYKGFLMAANYLPKFIPLITTAVGTIKPSNVLVIGTGVAGLQALANAKRLGAAVYAIDIRDDAREQAQSIGAKIIDVGIPEEIAVGSGGYANNLPDEWLNKERSIIKEHISTFDIIILSALVPGRVAPILITQDMVKALKSGSVIVDISIDQGGNCELTEPGKIVQKNGITIIGTKNIPGMLPLSSTWLFSKNIYNFLSYITQDSKINVNSDDEIISATIVTNGNKIVHAGALEAMGIYKR